MKRSNPWAAPLAAAAILWSACAAGLARADEATPPSPVARTPRLVVGVRGDVTSLNIYTATNAFSQEIADLLFPRLALEQDDFRDGPPTFRPSLARSWEISPDRISITFHLDPGARWSDGREVTSADVLFSYRAATSAEVAWVGSDVKEMIRDVTAPDARTVVFTFRKVYPYMLMDAVEGNVLPEHIYGKIPFAAWRKTAFLEAPVSGGPFALKRYERGSLIELGRDPVASGAAGSALGSLVFRIIPDEVTLVSELLSGGIDFMENVSEETARKIEAIPALRLERAPDLSYTFVCWNLARPLFADARVRRALGLAIDRKAIVEGLLPMTGRPSRGPILSFMWAHDGTLPVPAYDLAESRKLLREAGWGDGGADGILSRDGKPFRFELETNQGSTLRSDVVQMIAAQLRKIGVDAVPRTIEFGAFVAKHEKHDFDAFVSSWRESTKVDLKSAFHSASIAEGYNYGSYANPDLDALIDAARAESDPRAAADLWRRAQGIVVRDQPFAFLFERDRLNAVPRGLAGTRASPRSAYAGIESWTLRPEAAGKP